MNQGTDRVKKTEQDLTGASELRMLVRPLLYWVTKSSGVEKESVVKVTGWAERESRLMSLIFQKEMTWGGLEMARRRKWSVIWS